VYHIFMCNGKSCPKGFESTLRFHFLGLDSNIGHGLCVGWFEYLDIFCWVSFLNPTYLPQILLFGEQVAAIEKSHMSTRSIESHHSTQLTSDILGFCFFSLNHYSTTPLLHRSITTTPPLQYPPIFHNSITPPVQCPIIPSLHYSICQGSAFVVNQPLNSEP